MCQKAHEKVMSTFFAMVEQESVHPVPKVNLQDVSIKKEAQETQLPTVKNVVEENQIDSGVSEMKVEDMKFKEEQVDEDTFPMNLIDEMNLEGEKNPSETESAEAYKEPDNTEQNRQAASA